MAANGIVSNASALACRSIQQLAFGVFNFISRCCPISAPAPSHTDRARIPLPLNRGDGGSFSVQLWWVQHFGHGACPRCSRHSLQLRPGHLPAIERADTSRGPNIGASEHVQINFERSGSRRTFLQLFRFGQEAGTIDLRVRRRNRLNGCAEPDEAGLAAAAKSRLIVRCHRGNRRKDRVVDQPVCSRDRQSTKKSTVSIPS
jgi:hypothetical protein